MLVSTADGAIHSAKVKMKLTDIRFGGRGELRAHLHYELATASGEWSLNHAVSKSLPVESLILESASSMEFDFRENLILGYVNPVSLKIYRQDNSPNPPLIVAEFGADRLLVEEKESPVQSAPPPEGGVLIWGPETFLRDRGKPAGEQVSITVEEATGPFILRLTNGTAEGNRRVSSAIIRLNGREVFRPSEFNQQVGDLSRQIVLLPGENIMEVTLRSAPGSQFTLELFRIEKQACLVHDSRTFRRNKGKPFKEVDVFELKPQFHGPFTLSLTSGNPDGTQRVDSADIFLNEVRVFAPNDFNEQIGFLNREVMLQAVNALSVELRGAPGDFLTIAISGYDDIPPKVTITSPKDGEIFTEGPITVSGNVDNPDALLTINGIPVVLAADGSFFLEKMETTDEGNRIHAVATDTCGNRGEDQISVFLRPVQEGPLVTFCIGGAMPTIAARAADCRIEAFTWGFGGVRGTTDETANELSIDGILIPKGDEGITGIGNIDWAVWDGIFFRALLNIPGPDGTYPITAVAKDKAGGRTEVTVTFNKDTKEPGVAITFPKDRWVTNKQVITVTGTVDDPTAEVYLVGYEYLLLPVVDGAFSTETTLGEEGPNYVVIAAFDPAWNGSEAVIMVTLDTVPPEIEIPALTDGMVVNTPSLAVSGTFVDETPEIINVAVNGGAPQALALNETKFSGIAPISAGLNHLIFTAVDQAGNTSQLAKSIVLDMEPPQITISSPAAGANVSGMITIAVNTSDAGAGVASVTLLIDGHHLTTLTRAPFSHSVDTSDLPLGSHTITARAADFAGNQAETAITFSVSRVMIEIVSPANGATVNKSRAIVKGRIHNQTGEIGVLVNGILAEVQGNDFAVVVPLRIGQNMLTATAAAAGGLQVQTSVSITTERQEENVRLAVYPAAGILKLPANQLNVVFQA
ncbi:MAG: hypothetical protein EHM27_03815, partial [Deltaproteobacteria bacterium]